jgi:sulfur carrier protein
MRIVCNGAEQEVRAGITLIELLQELALNPDTVVAECNGTIVRREEYDNLVLPADGKLELVRFVGGG